MSHQIDQSLEKMREDFKKYLIKSNVFEALTKVLISIYELEIKPTNPLDYIRTHMTEIIDEKEELKLLKNKYDTIVTQIHEMEEENMNLAKTLKELQLSENDKKKSDKCELEADEKLFGQEE